MDNSDITLYADSSLVSPYAMSAFVALSEKFIPFELVTIDLEKRENLGTDFAQRSVTRRVPMLRHGDFYLSESSAIGEYLEDSFPAPDYINIYPTNGHERARARQIQAWLRSDFIPIREERSTQVIFFEPTDRPLSATAQASVEKLFVAADALISNGDRDLFAHWCIADMDLALMLNRLISNGDIAPTKLAQYVQRQWQRPSVQKWLALPRTR